MQYLSRAADLITGQNAFCIQKPHCPGRGIQLHRQRHQLEQNRQRKHDDPNLHQRGSQAADEQSDQNQGPGKPGADICHRHQVAANPQRHIAYIVLNGMSAFMGRYADGCHGAHIEHIIRQIHRFGPGIIVIGQRSADPLHLDIVNSLGLQQSLCRLSAGHAGSAPYSGVL